MEHVPTNDIFDKKYPITSVPEGDGIKYNIFLYDGVDEVSSFIEVISVLEAAQDVDTVIFKINSPGGYVHTTISILDAIDRCQASVFADCSGMVASAATIIALHCDDIHIAPYTTFMLHASSMGSYGKQHELLADVNYSAKNSADIMEEEYSKFLTNKEIKKLLEGKDYYFGAKEVERRWANVMEYRSKLMEEQQEQAQREYKQNVINTVKEFGYIVKKKKSGK